jgi:diguanylate cyclase (GGDEF)-like protein
LKRIRPQILLVNDRRLESVLLERMLNGMDLRIFRAGSGIDALGLMDCHDFMLAIVDVHMTGMDGYEIVDAMKSRNRTKDMPVILITEDAGRESNLVRGYESGVVDYMMKPVDPIMLRSKVRLFMELYSQRRRLDVQKGILVEMVKQLKMLRRENGRLEISSTMDSLTDIPNKRSFDSAMDSLWRSCMRDGLPLALAIVGIDCFRAYNEKYGHIQGDQCLINVSSAIAVCLNRPLDFVARHGGDEFAVIMPETDLNGGLSVCRSILRAVEKTEIPHVYGLPSSSVTVSVGLASGIPQQGDELEDFMRMAAEALCRAKSFGRNRIEEGEAML